MTPLVETIITNIKRLRTFKKLSQKQVCAEMGIPQGQYSRIENGKVEPTISTLDKLAKVFDVSLAAFFDSKDPEEAVNLPLMEKIKLMDQLEPEEKNALLKLIDMVIAKKKFKDNLTALLEDN